MKIRADFVSNSSSSSFVVAFPRKPENVEEVQYTLFHDLERIDDDCSLSTRQAAEIVFKDIQDQVPLTSSEIQEELSHGTPYPSYDTDLECPKLPTVFYSDNRFDWDQYFKDVEEWAIKATHDLISRNPETVFYRFSYADEDGGIWAQMEHGGIFNALPHIQLSHH